MARQLARRRQRERVVGSLVVCLGIAVLVVAVIALRDPRSGRVSAAGSASSVGKQSSASARPSKSKSSSSASASASHSTRASSADRTDVRSGSSVKSVPLIVLNNTTINGLAAQAASRFEAGGWTVTDASNYQNEILSTCAYYDASDPAAKAAAEALQAQYPAIKRVKPKFPELPAGPVVVVLTPDYAAG